MRKSSNAPWPVGAELRVLVNSREFPDIDYVPCIPVDGYLVSEIPNTEWVTYCGVEHLGESMPMYKFQYHEALVYIPSSMFKFLIHIPKRPQRQSRWRRGKRR